jgi:signal transduction histidine kinase/ActR/RegA family two-component response regulator
MHDVLASGSFWSVENVSDLPPTDGDLRGVLERGSIRSLIHVPMGYRGQVIGYTGLLSVTDPFPWTDREVEILHSLGELVAMSRARSQAEIDIRRAKEISETASQAKSRFLSSMSHELRTPLNGILGFADLLRGQYFGPLNEKQANFIQQIDDAGKHLLSLINDLLDIAKIDSGQMHLDTEEVDVAEAVQSVLSIMTPQFVKKSIRVESRIAPPGAMLIADLRKLKQILFNLLSNAAKYTPDGGTIEVWSEIGQGPSMTLFVRDSGIGIKPDELHKIFSEFYQADKIRDNQLGGTGIGLSLTRRLTELHGGQIGVESELGKGSTFWVRFPPSRVSIPRKAGVRSPLDAEAEPEGGATFSGYRILLVEDNEVNVSMMLDMLSIQGFEVVVARNGLEAVQQARERKMDLILMDMKMPVMNGLEATNLLRSMPKYAQTPIIALTASTGSEAEERQMRIGCTEHLAKPIQIQKLFEVLKKYLGNEIPTSNPEA